MGVQGVKNTSLPEELRAEVEQIAQAERRDADELVQEAVERMLRLRRREKLYAYGEQRATVLGIKEGDVPRLVKESRTPRGR